MAAVAMGLPPEVGGMVGSMINFLRQGKEFTSNFAKEITKIIIEMKTGQGLLQQRGEQSIEMKTGYGLLQQRGAQSIEMKTGQGLLQQRGVQSIEMKTGQECYSKEELSQLK